jgi:hypothetical protein
LLADPLVSASRRDFDLRYIFYVVLRKKIPLLGGSVVCSTIEGPIFGWFSAISAPFEEIVVPSSGVIVAVLLCGPVASLVRIGEGLR